MEFQPVIMAAGRGSRMYPLTEATPKALLSVGNHPMIYYPVKMLEKAGFEEVIVVVLKSALSQIRYVLQEVYRTPISVDFVSIPDDQDTGTADALRYVAPKLRGADVLVVSCDTITDVALHRLADVHRLRDATLTMLLGSNDSSQAEKDAVGTKTKKRLAIETGERDFVGLDNDRVLFFSAQADLDEEVVIRKSMLERFPSFTIYTRLVDAHLYLMKKWVVDFLGENKSLSSIKGELLPYLVRKQFVRTQKGMVNLDVSGMSNSLEKRPENDVFNFANSSHNSILQLAEQMSTSGIGQDIAGGRNNVKCYAAVVKDGFCIRANTVPFYMEANRQIAKQTSVHSTATIKPKSQVGSDSLVGEGTSIGEKCSVKWSIIGKHCVLSDKVKVSNCVIMDYVTIKEGCNLQQCIVCENAHVDEGCSLKDCQVAKGFTVKGKTDAKGEVLIAGGEMQF
ncbi:translation initiation factor eIF2B subunit gamma-like isoform X2 [Oscarella lobularis]|uniref:translation initiation factor eIF2B subunit gamma-like isoform X2 n=1 Tax=Oscarella lobularis TaxID=121494 RepID=UPI003314116F